MLPSFTFDDSLWPLLIVRFGDAISSRCFEAALEQRSAYLRRREKHIVLYDTSRASLRLLTHRQRYVEWLQSLDEADHENMLGVALVITSPSFRLALTSVLHLLSRRPLYFAASSEQGAVCWAADRLFEAGFSRQAERIRLHYGLPPVENSG